MVGCLLLYVVVWLLSLIYGMGLWTSATHYNAQLGPQDKGRAMKGLVVCWSMARINDL